MIADDSLNCGSDDFSSASVVAGGAGSSGEFMLFGVRVRVDPLRKCVSLNNLSQYEHPNDTTENEPAKAAVVDDGYNSADDDVLHRSSNCRGRKRGVPWTEEEHKLFLLGLQKVGKGNWRGISRNYVKTRTPTQVASHAQKHFLRRTNVNRRRRRSSLFDITSASVSSEEGKSAGDSSLSSTTLILPPVTVLQARDEDSQPAEPSSYVSLNLTMSLDQSWSSSMLQGMPSFINGDSVVSVG